MLSGYHYLIVIVTVDYSIVLVDYIRMMMVIPVLRLI